MRITFLVAVIGLIITVPGPGLGQRAPCNDATLDNFFQKATGQSLAAFLHGRSFVPDGLFSNNYSNVSCAGNAPQIVVDPTWWYGLSNDDKANVRQWVDDVWEMVSRNRGVILVVNGHRQ